jgi:hypothetical protein
LGENLEKWLKSICLERFITQNHNIMSKSILFALLLGPGALLLFAACDPGNTCGDPALVAIPATDDSEPELTWMITQASVTPDGPISSIGPYTGAEVTITAKPTDEVKVYLIARDEQSGIKQVSMTGGFGQTCTSGSGAIAASGILPEQSQDLSFLTVCGMIEWRLPEIPIEVGMPCVAGNTLAQLSFGLTGTAENNKGGTVSSRLTITVTP